MKACALDTYLVEIRPYNSRRASTPACNLSDFDGKGSSLKAYVKKQISDNPGFMKQSLESRCYKFQNYCSVGDYISVEVTMGDYGATSDITDIESGQKTHTKKKTEIDPFNYVVLLEHPANSKAAILCVQRMGVSGISDYFKTFLLNGLKNDFADHRLHFRNIMPSELLKTLFSRAELEEMIFQKFEIPSDIADMVAGRRASYEGTLEVRIRPKSQGLFDRDGIIAMVDYPANKVLMPGLPGTYANVVKAKVSTDGKTRTLNLTRPDSFHASYNIDDEIKLGLDGNPTSASVRDAASSIANELISQGALA